MTLTRHQELINLIENLAIRIVVVQNPIDRELMEKAIEYLVELQSHSSKDLK